MKIFQKRYTWAVCMMLAASNMLTHAKNHASGTGTVSNPQKPYKDTTISDEKIKGFLKKMKKAVDSNDPEKMAEIFDFTEKCVEAPSLADPCPKENLKKVFLRNGEYISKQQLIDNYDQIITPDIRDLIENATLQDVWERGDDGLALGAGRIWFHPDKGIKAIND
jgi:hypothetical protein